MLNHKRLVFSVIMLICFQPGTHAQLGDLLNKAKSKVAKASKPAVSSGNTEAATPAAGVPVDAPLANGPHFQLAEDFGYSTGRFGYTAGEFQKKGNRFWPHTHIRKEGEQGGFHFAKDYPELKPLIIQSEVPATIVFSKTPFKKGETATTNSFTSKDHIYAKLVTTNGTIKEALSLAEDVSNVVVYYYIYGDDDRIAGNSTTIGGLYITKDMANEKELSFDILPAADAFKVIRKPDGNDIEYYTSYFPALHNQYNFPKNGNYHVGINLKYKLLDEWGNPTDKATEAYGSFAYTFSASDAKRITDEGALVREKIKSNPGVAKVPVEWSEKSYPLAGIGKAQLEQIYRERYPDKLKGWITVKIYANSGGSGWVVEKNEFGIPLYRYSQQYYTIFMKGVEGKACFFEAFGLRQDYMGAGTYGKTFADNEGYKYVKCEELK